MPPGSASRAQDIADAVNTALLGQVASYVLEGDRIVNIRVLAEPKSVNRIAELRELPMRTADGAVVRLDQVADVSVRAERGGIGSATICGRTSSFPRGSKAATSAARCGRFRPNSSQDKWLPPGTVEYGGLYQQQQESFRNLLVVLLARHPARVHGAAD